MLSKTAEGINKDLDKFPVAIKVPHLLGLLI